MAKGPSERPPERKDTEVSRPLLGPDIRKFIRTWGMAMALVVVFSGGILAGALLSSTWLQPNPATLPPEVLSNVTSGASNATPTALPTPDSMAIELHYYLENNGFMTGPFHKSTSRGNFLYEGTAYKNSNNYVVTLVISPKADTFMAVWQLQKTHVRPATTQMLIGGPVLWSANA